MSSLSGFYKRISVDKHENGAQVSVELNPDHEVYAGHFPGRPIAPGAALTQMVIDEALKLWPGHKRVPVLRQIKFLSVIDPNEVPHLSLDFTVRTIDSKNTFSCIGRSGDKIYFKLNGIFG